MRTERDWQESIKDLIFREYSTIIQNLSQAAFSSFERAFEGE
jgi:hypothetical protein